MYCINEFLTFQHAEEWKKSWDLKMLILAPIDMAKNPEVFAPGPHPTGLHDKMLNAESRRTFLHLVYAPRQQKKKYSMPCPFRK